VQALGRHQLRLDVVDDEDVLHVVRRQAHEEEQGHEEAEADAMIIDR
jgi:hypothetical protein